MARGLRVAVVFGGVLLLLLAGLYLFVRGRGFDARTRPGSVEAAVALRLRQLAIPDGARRRANPVRASDEVRRDGLAHFADHCAVCHGNDGAGDTAFGRGLYPKPPDLRHAPTQQLTDGELFYIIEHGVPLTGMPGFGTGAQDGELATWHLVHFIRQLPRLSDEEIAEMTLLNPRSPAEIRQEIEEERFLQGEVGKTLSPPATPHRHPGGRNE